MVYEPLHYPQGTGTAVGTVPVDRARALAGLPGNDKSEGRETWRALSCSALLLESRDGWGRGEQEHSDTNVSVQGLAGEGGFPTAVTPFEDSDNHLLVK